MDVAERLSHLEAVHDWQGLAEELEQDIASDTDAASKPRITSSSGRLLEDKFLQAVQALKHFQDAYKLNPPLTEALREARHVYWSLGKINMVQKLLELELKSAQEHPAATELLIELGDVLCDHGDWEKATATYARALSASGGAERGRAGRSRRRSGRGGVVRGAPGGRSSSRPRPRRATGARAVVPARGTDGQALLARTRGSCWRRRTGRDPSEKAGGCAARAAARGGGSHAGARRDAAAHPRRRCRGPRGPIRRSGTACAGRRATRTPRSARSSSKRRSSRRPHARRRVLRTCGISGERSENEWDKVAKLAEKVADREPRSSVRRRAGGPRAVAERGQPDARALLVRAARGRSRRSTRASLAFEAQIGERLGAPARCVRASRDR